jgi:hypothetical protein
MIGIYRKRNMSRQTHNLTWMILALALAIPAASHATEGFSILINFETTPALEQGPSEFSEAGPEQNISVDGVSIDGGVVLGDPGDLASYSEASPPNVYGTADYPAGGSFGDSLPSTITIDIDPAVESYSVQGLLFNGMKTEENYEVYAYSGEEMVDSDLIPDLAPNTSASDYTEFSVSSDGSPITEVTIAPDLVDSVVPGQWDYVIDNVDVQETGTAAIPEPGPLGLACLGLAPLFIPRRKRIAPCLRRG